MSIRSTLTLATLMLAGVAQAQSTPIQQWQIIEGKGLTDNYVFLGMTRKQAVTVHRDCRGKVSRCSFQPQDGSGTLLNTPVVTLNFDAKNKVSSIDVNQGGRDIQWPTTAGAVDSMTADQVKALYPGSTLVRGDSGDATVTAAKQGYVFNQDFSCAPFEPCFPLVLHSIVKPKKAQ